MFLILCSFLIWSHHLHPQNADFWVWLGQKRDFWLFGYPKCHIWGWWPPNCIYFGVLDNWITGPLQCHGPTNVADHFTSRLVECRCPSNVVTVIVDSRQKTKFFSILSDRIKNLTSPIRCALDSRRFFILWHFLIRASFCYAFAGFLEISRFSGGQKTRFLAILGPKWKFLIPGTPWKDVFRGAGRLSFYETFWFGRSLCPKRPFFGFRH